MNQMLVSFKLRLVSTHFTPVVIILAQQHRGYAMLDTAQRQRLETSATLDELSGLELEQFDTL